MNGLGKTLLTLPLLLVAASGVAVERVKQRAASESNPGIVPIKMAVDVPAPLHAAPGQPDAKPVIVILETRNYRVKIHGSGEKALYSVMTNSGVALAERLKPAELKARFPELHEIVAGPLWAGELAEPARFR
ncbi:MAG: hypothetical protein AB1898_15310 [Acidobacteriota bacterium]